MANIIHDLSLEELVRLSERQRRPCVIVLLREGCGACDHFKQSGVYDKLAARLPHRPKPWLYRVHASSAIGTLPRLLRKAPSVPSILMFNGNDVERYEGPRGDIARLMKAIAAHAPHRAA